MPHAECEACKRVMDKGVACRATHLMLKDGSSVPRLRFGDNGEYTDEGCHDCNVKSGQFHHPGCDMAVCPICGGQESFCECPIEAYAWVEGGN